MLIGRPTAQGMHDERLERGDETAAERRDSRQRRLRPRSMVAASVAPASGGRRASVIAATVRLVARDGVAALSTRRIAREATVNLATLHYLFGNKDDLLVAALTAVTDTMIDTLTTVVPAGGLPAALAASYAALGSMLDQARALPLVRCELMLYASRRPAHAHLALAQQRRYLAALEAHFRASRRPGDRCAVPLNRLAALVGGSGDGLTMQAVARVPDAEMAATLHALQQSVLALIQPCRPRIRKAHTKNEEQLSSAGATRDV